MKLNKNKVYDLSELTSEELKQVLSYLKENDKYWHETELEDFSNQLNDYKLRYFEHKKEWNWTKEKPTHNAKELFYTLENIHVDCRELSEERIKEMADVFGKTCLIRKPYAKKATLLIKYRENPDFEYNTITYEKFMELFAEPKHTTFDEFYEKEKERINNLGGAQPHYDNTNDFKQITDSIASLLQYKNEKYGNSALEPLNVFQGKCKVGQRLDDKLARVKNNTMLQKNDVADLIGYLFLVCKENNWNNFDEFKD